MKETCCDGAGFKIKKTSEKRDVVHPVGPGDGTWQVLI